MALGSHPEVGFVGETHHVLPHMIDNYKSNRNGEIPLCAECREACPIWSPCELPMEAAGLHAKLANRLERSVIVDSSKVEASFRTYENANPDVEFRYIITIKPPARQIASYRRYGTMLEDVWRSVYSEYDEIADFVRKRKFIVVNYLDLIAKPMLTLQRVGKLLGLPPDPKLSTTNYPRAHQIPGNDRAIRAQKPVDANADTDWTAFTTSVSADLLAEMEETYQRILKLGERL
jgi:hypothetical protein